MRHSDYEAGKSSLGQRHGLRAPSEGSILVMSQRPMVKKYKFADVFRYADDEAEREMMNPRPSAQSGHSARSSPNLDG